MPRQFALLIGVNDYAVYERSTNAAPGSANLRGALEDVKTWWRICRRLGIAAEDIQVRTWPLLHPLELGLENHAAQCGPATAADLQEAFHTLGTALAGDETSGILMFSGHGTMKDGACCLCPSDTEGAELVNAITLRDVEVTLDALAPDRSLFIALDACHGGVGPRGQTRCLAASGAVTLEAPETKDCLILSSKPGEPSSERVLGGRWQGTFTWAASTVLEQWSVRGDEHGRFFDISSRELCRRSNALLAALDDDQTPTCLGPPRNGSLAFGRVRSARRPADVQRARDFSDAWRELWGGNEIKFYQINSTSQVKSQPGFGWVIVNTQGPVTVNQVTYAGVSEYWLWNVPAAPWPDTFWLVPLSTPPAAPPVPPSSHFQHRTFDGVPVTPPPDGAGFNVSVNGSVQAFLQRVAGNHLRWYEIAGAAGSVIGNGGPIRFSQSAPPTTNVKFVDELIVTN